MSWRTSIFCFSFILFNCSQGNHEANVDTSPDDSPRSKYLIEVEEFAPLLGTPNIKVIDFRRKVSYTQGHIPGAINIWRTDIESRTYPYRGMKADAGQIEKLFQNVGIENGDQLIVYDDVGSCDAARFWWVLQSYDFKDLKILNGGLDSWKGIAGMLTTKNVEMAPSNFKLASSPDDLGLISTEELKHELSQSNPPIVLDNRTLDEFTGKRQKEGAIAAGHLSGSIHIDWVANVNHVESKDFKSLAELKAIYEPLRISKDQAIVTYCHTGVRSALTYFVLTELLNYENVRNYDGSWVEWSHMELPFEQDSVTVLFD